MTAPLVQLDRRAELPSAVWSAWSCDVRVVVAGGPAALDFAVRATVELMRRVDLAASRFRTDSELSRANQNVGRPMAVSRLFLDLLNTAVSAAELTGGAVDPLLGASLAAIGYDRDILLIRDAGPDHSLVDGQTVVAGAVAPDAPRPSRRIRLDQLAGLLTVPAGCALDLGATAKAWTADRAASDIAARLGCSVLVEIGGDLAVAGPPRQWQIAVGERAGVPGQQVSLTSGGMATSTTTVRRWPHGGRMVHHVIDPATGRSADGPWRTATVAARSAVLANCRSTAAIVLGAAALAWLTEQRADGRLVGVDGTTRTVGRWPEPAGPAPACPTAGSIYTRVAAEASSERS